MEELSAPQIVDDLIQNAQNSRASDIHLQMIGKKARIHLRIDGVMVASRELNENIAEKVFGRIKFLSKLKTYQESLPQDGRIPSNSANAQNDIRVSTYPTVTGEKIVLRLFVDSAIKTIEELEFSDRVIQPLRTFLQQSTGLLLLTGPAGSGKTTTIYACLQYLRDLGGRHIITIEDPVERIIDQIMQTEIKPERGLTFAKASKHLLRQDPQMLVIGEIRDNETANIAIRATLTGHMVISTLHAGSCRGVIDRLTVMAEDSHTAIYALSLILNQRLIRKICKYCSGQKCKKCYNTGYMGRIPIVEWVQLEDSIRALVCKEGTHVISPEITLLDEANRLVADNKTNHFEFMRVFGSENR